MAEQENVVRASLVDQVYDFILRRIRQGELRPGDRLNIEELSREFGVSRTPMREAVSRLTQDGFLETKYSVGPSVAVLSRARSQELIEANMLLMDVIAERVLAEGDTAALAAILTETVAEQREMAKTGEEQRFFTASVRFHEEIIRACPNQVLAEVGMQLQRQLDAFVLAYLEWEGKREDSIREHGAIAACLKQGDGQGFRETLRLHNETPLRHFIQEYAENREG